MQKTFIKTLLFILFGGYQNLCLSVVHAGEVMHSDIHYDGARFQLRLEMKVVAEPETVYAILTDFNHLKELNDNIKVSRLLQSDGLQHKVKIIIEGCIWFYCQSIRQVQNITELGKGSLQAITIPTESNIKYGRTMWHLHGEDDFTIIHYQAEIVPEFFIPPIIGPYLMKRRFLVEAKKTINGIERLAENDESY